MGVFIMLETRRWHWVDTVFVSIRAAYLFVSILMLITLPQLDHTPFWLLLFWFVASFALPHLFWRPSYIHPLLYTVAELLFSGSLAIYLVLITGETQGYLQLAAMTIGLLATKKMWWWAPSIFIVLFPIIEISITGDPFSRLLLGVISNLMVFGIGISFHHIIHSSQKMKQLLEENNQQYQLIEEQNKTLVQYSEQVETLTLLEERNRMARELHDTVGHTFTSVIMGMDAVIYLIDKDPDEAKNKLEVLRTVTRNSLDEVMKNIHQIASNEEVSYE